MRSERRLVRRAHNEFMATDLDVEQVLMDPHDGHYYGLNSTARFIFSLLDHPVEVQEVVDRVAERYGIPRGQAAADVAAFLQEMEGYKLVVLSPPPNGE